MIWDSWLIKIGPFRLTLFEVQKHLDFHPSNLSVVLLDTIAWIRSSIRSCICCPIYKQCTVKLTQQLG